MKDCICAIIDQSEGRSGMYFNEVKKNFGFGCMRLPLNDDEWNRR